MPPQKRKQSRKGAAANAAAAMASNLSSRLDFLNRIASQAGIQYSGKRDIYGTAGYIKPGAERFEDYWGMYQRGDVAGRIVDLPAKTTWRTPPEVAEEGESESKFAKEFALMAKRLRLWHYFGRADKLAGVGRYAVIFIGTKVSSDTELKQPLIKASADQILYLSVFHEKNAEITEYVKDPGSPRFGLPQTYKLRTGTDSKFKGGNELIVDSSRVIHVAEDLLEDDVHGRPRLKRALNRMFDMDKVAGATGEAYWQMAIRILQAKVAPEVEMTQKQFEDLDEKLTAMTHDLKRHFYGQGVELSTLPEGTPNVQQVADFYFSLIAAAADIPKRILFGSEMGELASSTDQETYFGAINERQESFAEPMIVRAFVDRMIGITALPKPKQGEYVVNWKPLFEESADEKAATSLKVAQTASALTPVGGSPLALVTIDSEGVVQLIEREEGDELPDGMVSEPEPEPLEPDLTEDGAGVNPGTDDAAGDKGKPKTGEAQE